MNILKKLRLKSQLAGCDFELAGTVIHQQYYQKNSNSELNRLIDEFMAEPTFDNAVKLIDYNEMMIFYFTESRTGGLYVQKRQQASDPSAHSEEADAPTMAYGAKLVPAEDAKPGASGKGSAYSGVSEPRPAKRSRHTRSEPSLPREKESKPADSSLTDETRIHSRKTPSGKTEEANGDASEQTAKGGSPNGEAGLLKSDVPDMGIEPLFSITGNPYAETKLSLDDLRAMVQADESGGPEAKNEAKPVPDQTKSGAPLRAKPAPQTESGRASRETAAAAEPSDPPVAEALSAAAAAADANDKIASLKHTIDHLFDETEQMISKSFPKRSEPANIWMADDAPANKPAAKPALEASARDESRTVVRKPPEAPKPASRQDQSPTPNGEAFRAANVSKPEDAPPRPAQPEVPAPAPAGGEVPAAKSAGSLVRREDFNLRDVKPEHTLFPNVIATILIDIKEMQKQIRDARLQMSTNPSAVRELEQWVSKLQAGVSEFTLAVEILSEFKK